MQINLDLLRNKQRILITGNSGVDQITDMLKHVMNYAKKEFHILGDSNTNAPVVILASSDQVEIDLKKFTSFEPHILLIHGIKEKLIPSGYSSFESYITQFEDAADSLPKAGSYIYNEDDDVANMIGTKAREDVNNLKYAKLKESQLPVYLRDKEANFLEYASATLALSKRIGINDELFFEALSTKK